MQTETGIRIAIVGAGISGMAAAVELLKSQTTTGLPTHGDLQITVFDGRQHVGGILRTTTGKDSLIEQSADMFTTKLPFALKLCQTIGYQSQLIPTRSENRGAKLATGSGLQSIPAGFSLLVPKQVGSVLRSPILTLAGKMRLVAEPVFLFFNRRYRLQGNERDESLQDFAVRHYGWDVFNKIIQPLVAGIYTADPAKLSMKAALAEFVDLERRHGRLLWSGGKSKQKPNEADGDFQDSLSAGGNVVVEAGGKAETASDESASGARYGLFLTPKFGMQHWMESIRDWLVQRNCQFQLGHEVKSIGQSAHQWEIVFQNASTQNFDAVIVATPVQAAAKLLAKPQNEPGNELTSELASELAQLESASAAIVVAMIDRDALPNRGKDFGFGVVVPEYLKRPIIACSFSSHKFPGRSLDDQLLIRCFFGGAMHPERMLDSDEDLIQLATNELQDLLVAPKLELKDARVVRWEQAMPQYHVGHLDRIEGIEAIVKSIRGLALAGNAYRGVGIPQCIDSGERAARKILADLTSDDA